MFSLAGIISGDTKDGECPGLSQDLFNKIEKEDFQHNYDNIPARFIHFIFLDIQYFWIDLLL